MKRIGILTSGGDAPGMNAAIRAVVRHGIYLGLEVFGIGRGYSGLINGEVFPMDMRSVSDIIQRGGTILKTARCPEMKTEEGRAIALKTIKEFGLEGVVVIGGDGSFMGAKILSDRGVPAVGIPGTIDNDLAYTDYTLGFDTACNTALDAINKLRDTMTSHERISIVEVMGRHCGDIALYAGLAGGAEVIIVPELEYDIDDISQKLIKSHSLGKKSGIIVLAEGAGKAEDIAVKMEERTGFNVRATVLGHIQRGGGPSMADRILGSRCGVRAVDLLHKNIGGRVVGVRHNKLFDIDITECLSQKKQFDMELYKIANILSK